MNEDSDVQPNGQNPDEKTDGKILQPETTKINTNNSNGKVPILRKSNAIVTLVYDKFKADVNYPIHDVSLMALEGFYPVIGRFWKFIPDEQKLIIQMPRNFAHVYTYSFWSKNCYGCDNCHKHRRSSKVILINDKPVYERDTHDLTCLKLAPSALQPKAMKRVIIRPKNHDAIPRRRTYDIHTHCWGFFPNSVTIWVKSIENPLVIHIYEKSVLNNSYICVCCQENGRDSYLKLMFEEDKLLEVSKHLIICAQPSNVIRNIQSGREHSIKYFNELKAIIFHSTRNDFMNHLVENIDKQRISKSTSDDDVICINNNSNDKNIQIRDKVNIKMLKKKNNVQNQEQMSFDNEIIIDSPEPSKNYTEETDDYVIQDIVNKIISNIERTENGNNKFDEVTNNIVPSRKVYLNNNLFNDIQIISENTTKIAPRIYISNVGKKTLKNSVKRAIGTAYVNDKSTNEPPVKKKANNHFMEDNDIEIIDISNDNEKPSKVKGGNSIIEEITIIDSDEEIKPCSSNFNNRNNITESYVTIEDSIEIEPAYLVMKKYKKLEKKVENKVINTVKDRPKRNIKPSSNPEYDVVVNSVDKTNVVSKTKSNNNNNKLKSNSTKESSETVVKEKINNTTFRSRNDFMIRAFDRYTVNKFRLPPGLKLSLKDHVKFEDYKVRKTPRKNLELIVVSHFDRRKCTVYLCNPQYRFTDFYKFECIKCAELGQKVFAFKFYPSAVVLAPSSEHICIPLELKRVFPEKYAKKVQGTTIKLSDVTPVRPKDLEQNFEEKIEEVNIESISDVAVIEPIKISEIQHIEEDDNETADVYTIDKNTLEKYADEVRLQNNCSTFKKVKLGFWSFSKQKTSNNLYISFRIRGKQRDKTFDLVERQGNVDDGCFIYTCRYCEDGRESAVYMTKYDELYAEPITSHRCYSKQYDNAPVKGHKENHKANNLVKIPDHLWIIPCDEDYIIKKSMFIVHEDNQNKGREFMLVGKRMDEDLLFVCKYCNGKKKMVHAVLRYDGKIVVKAESNHYPTCQNINLINTLRNENFVLTNPIH